MELVRPGGTGGEPDHFVQPAWWARRHSGCSPERMPAFWWQKGQVPAADFRRLERGTGVVSEAGSITDQTLGYSLGNELSPRFCNSTVWMWSFRSSVTSEIHSFLISVIMRNTKSIRKIELRLLFSDE